MRAVNHDSLLLPFLSQCLLDHFYAFCIVVCAFGTTTKNDKAVFIPTSSCNGSETLLRNTHEGVLCSSGTNSIDCNSQASVSTVLESYRERETGGQFAMQL